MRCVTGDIETDWRQIYPYIATLIDILTLANLSSASPSLDIFWIIASFVSATGRDFGPLFPAVVNGLAAHLKAGIAIRPDSEVPPTFAGFLPLFVKLESDLKHCPDALAKFCWSLTALAVQGSPSLIIPGVPPAEAHAGVILLLVPYFATLCDEGLFARFASAASLDVRPVWEYYRGTSPLSFADVIAPIVKPFAAGVANEDALETVLRAYALFVKTLPDFGPPVYAVCTVLLNRGVAPAACAGLAKVAQHDRANRNALTACEFLEAARTVTFGQPAADVAQARFPVMELPSSFAPAGWKSTDSANACDGDAPPFYPTDPTLTLLPYARALKTVSLAVRITPFTEWSERMFAVEAMPPCVEPQDVPPIEEAQVKQFKAKLRQIEQSGQKLQEKLLMTRQSQPRIDLVDPTIDGSVELFLPDQAEIDAAGADIPGAEFPSVFPL
jgi:hypothetical protein